MGDLILTLFWLIIAIILFGFLLILIGTIGCMIVWFICKLSGKENRLTEIVDDIFV